MTPDERDEDLGPDWAEIEAEAEMARWDDDPNPYSGTYSED
jgi:hypothetical protein